MEELFAPPGYDWRRVSPRYCTLRRLIEGVLWPVLFAVPAAVVGFATGRWWLSALLVAAGLAVAGVRYAFLARVCRAWGYVERADDLYVTHGVMFRSLVAVPYGRMQLVEVEAGPLERAFGLATVTLKTASPETDARIPGLPPAEAVRLRDRLTELGESRASGL